MATAHARGASTRRARAPALVNGVLIAARHVVQRSLAAAHGAAAAEKSRAPVAPHTAAAAARTSAHSARVASSAPAARAGGVPRREAIRARLRDMRAATGRRAARESVQSCGAPEAQATLLAKQEATRHVTCGARLRPPSPQHARRNTADLRAASGAKHRRTSRRAGSELLRALRRASRPHAALRCGARPGCCRPACASSRTFGASCAASGAPAARTASAAARVPAL